MKLKFYFLQLIVFLSLISCEKEMQQPKLIEFEKQSVINQYDWELITLSAKTLNFITKSRKVIFIYYWSINDENIKNNLDKLEEFYANYNTKLEFVFVTSDKQDEVRKFLTDNEYTFPVFYSLSPIPKPMSLDATKKAYLINKKGRIVVENQGDANWNSDFFYEVVDGVLKQ